MSVTLHCIHALPADACPQQEASALENSCAKEKYYVNWRNAMLNGSPLTREGLFKIRNYTIPDTGTLRLDYVTYKVRGGGDLLTIQRIGVAGKPAAQRTVQHRSCPACAASPWHGLASTG